MDLNKRLLIARIKPLHKLLRAIMYNSGYLFYRRIYKNKGYKEYFESIKDSKRGQRAFIIGNGPSLKPEDLDKLEFEDTFAANDIHKIFPQTSWRPTYYVIWDRYTKTTPEIIRDIECEKVFLGDYYCRFNKVLRKDAIFLHQHCSLSTKKYKFSDDISKFLVCTPTVSYGSMQIASYMGYSEIILLGFDHGYPFEYNPDGSIKKNDTSNSHFFKDDAPEDIIADVEGMTKSYVSFKQYADKNRISVMNATRGGKLEVFPRVSFDDLFERKEI